jgi:LysM repeat protein
MVLTIAFVLYLAGCFGSEETSTANAETPTPVVPTPTPPPVVAESAASAQTAAEEPFVHTVEEGDRLPTIAAKYNVTTDVILRANPDLDPNVLIVGQQLRIPGATTNNAVLKNPDAEREAGESVDYVVQSGDSLGLIADTYVVGLDALIAANPGVDPNALQIGQLLVIPPIGTGLSPEAIAARSTPVPVQRPPGEVLYHVVQAGDLLSTLADLYSVDVADIIAANGLDDANQILIGQELVIPPPKTSP